MPSSRASKPEPIGPVPIAIGAAVVGGIAYWFLRPQSAAAAAAPTPTALSASSTSSSSQASTSQSSQPGSMPSQSGGQYQAYPQLYGTVATAPGQPTLAPVSDIDTSVPNPSGQAVVPGISPTTLARLRNSGLARQIFALQAMAYVTGYSNVVPDGVEGGSTDAVIRGLTGTTSYAQGTLAAVRGALSGSKVIRSLPFALPPDVITAVNHSALSADPNTILLQVRQAPAGQAIIPVAGYGRIPSSQYANTVGGNPGFGVYVDPYGMNIGLYEQLYGHGQWTPSGSIAADIGINPIAGQDGGYFAGYPSM